MVTVLCLMCSYLYTYLLYVYFYKNALGLKYTLKIAVIGTLCMCVCMWFVKLFPQYIFGVQVTGIASIVSLILNFVYVIVCYSSSVKKRILVAVLYMILQAVMDLMGLRIAGMLTGNYELTMSNDFFGVMAVLCSCTTITLGTFLITWLWKIIEQKQWKYEKYQWISVILPISQYFIMQWIGMRYSDAGNPLPVIVIVGFMLGIVTDIYMFYLFHKLNEKNQAQADLKRMKHQRELEQVRYEQLKKNQEETAKIRHDFQNYLLTLKRME